MEKRAVRVFAQPFFLGRFPTCFPRYRSDTNSSFKSPRPACEPQNGTAPGNGYGSEKVIRLEGRKQPAKPAGLHRPEAGKPPARTQHHDAMPEKIGSHLDRSVALHPDLQRVQPIPNRQVGQTMLPPRSHIVYQHAFLAVVFHIGSAVACVYPFRHARYSVHPFAFRRIAGEFVPPQALFFRKNAYLCFKQ